jgi:hypothetical protein
VSNKPKARLTAKGNVKVTLTQREARLIVALLGPTDGALGMELYVSLEELVGDPETFNSRLADLGIDTDKVPE